MPSKLNPFCSKLTNPSYTELAALVSLGNNLLIAPLMLSWITCQDELLLDLSQTKSVLNPVVIDRELAFPVYISVAKLLAKLGVAVEPSAAKAK